MDEEAVTEKEQMSELKRFYIDKDGGRFQEWLIVHKLYVSSSPYDDGEGKCAGTQYRKI